MRTEHVGRVVVGVDGSAAALHAVEWAAAEAVARAAVLRIVHVATDRAPDPVFGAPDPDRDYGESALLDAAAVVVGQPRCPVVEPVYRTGEVTAVLDSEARNADLLVVGSVGVGTLGELLVGSTAATLASSAPATVAIVRTPRGRCPRTSDSRPVVVAAMSGSVDQWSHMMRVARRESEFRGGSVIAVLPRPVGNGAQPAAGDTLVQRWVEADPSVQIRIVTRPGQLADRVVAESRGARLVVTGPPEEDRSTLVSGHVMHALLRHAQCPVMVERTTSPFAPGTDDEPVVAPLARRA